MTPRTRDTLLLIAGLPGVVAVFLPVIDFFGPISPAHFLLTYVRNLFRDGLPEAAFWIALPVLLPMAVATLQLCRLARGTLPQRALTVASTVVALLAATCLVLAAHFLLTEEWGRDAQPIAALVLLSTANLALLYHNLRRRRALALVTEVLMLGTYVAVMQGWLIDLLKEPYIGPKLILWTCLVYVATIVIRLRASSNRVAPST
jgi:hypothetical protein